jgi:peptidyl-prolyl cis-trans isomerase A (cyclophilin A)
MPIKGSTVIRISLLILSLLMSFQLFAANTKGQYIQPNNFSPKVRIETSMGNVIIELDRYRAKITVDNFLGYVTRGQYDKTMIHRVEEGYLIQGGGFMTNYTDVEPDAPIFNESGNGLKNKEGTIAMAKQLNDAHSATNQFFINLNDNSNLDPGSSWGYAVFGEVIEGYEILEAMAEVEVGFSEDLGYTTVPKKMITIIRVVILDEES